MAQPNGLNPDFIGRVTASGFDGSHGHGVSVTCVPTNGVTNVDVFAATNGFYGTVTGCYLINKTTTPLTVTLKGPATVCTIQTGASATMIGAITLSNTAITPTGTLVVVSDAVGKDAFVFVTYQVVR